VTVRIRSIEKNQFTSSGIEGAAFNAAVVFQYSGGS
jgi:hypothetical protein